ncbi:MAG TPA: bifunctional (p)ppGpp synthetase/guanosine-3',5'-bis(diphosphate) 3'-pyrophosphohydrolase [Candidatus Eisenbacteria bacterium]|jgi:GTP pyrophosphokinase|nr:bifunctional (p)ppGpp synthetase/guanosine-3',5'-bis(diphosphate) 3'-pyrophosphohydrolase [Candidatus Eisenbacteria bacterium]
MDPVPAELPGPLLEALQRSNRTLDLEKIGAAYRFAVDAHGSQLRKSGEPYVTHLTAVATILADLLGSGIDNTLIEGALLHDVVEDTTVTLQQVERRFGRDVAALVDGVTKIGHLHFERPEQEEAENFRKMLFSMARDLRVILIKLADRLHNMRTLTALGPARAHRIARETREIYAPLAHRLGIARIKWELEDLCLKHLDPEAYREIRDKVQLKREERERQIQDVVQPVKSRLVHLGMKADVVGRPKHLESIYRKMQAQGRKFEEIYDLLGARVIVHDKADCYRVLGVVHDLFTPVHERFKDYIATPKSNMYQSLHTTVVAPGGLMVEFQIRTQSMHQIAELGVAAHYRYKEGGAAGDSELLAKLAPVLRNPEWQSTSADPVEFLDLLKTSLYQDEVFVFTPRGELRSLPRGATPIDFAYLVHTEVGNHCVGAKVNNRIVPLRYELRSGDKVQIITSPMGKPNRDWLKVVKSPGARTKIRHWLKVSEHADSVTLGKEMLERELRRRRLTPPATTTLDDLARGFGHGDADGLYAALGSGTLALAQVIQRWFPAGLGPVQRLKEASLEAVRAITGRPGHGVRIQGVDNLMVSFARCCQPVPGDSVVGIVTRGRGVTVHRTDCPNTFDDRVAPERRVLVDWSAAPEDAFSVKLSIYGQDRKSLLADIAKAIATTNTNIRTAGIKANDRNARGAFVVEVRDLAHLRQVMKAVEQVDGVDAVEREQVFGRSRGGESGMAS